MYTIVYNGHVIRKRKLADAKQLAQSIYVRTGIIVGIERK